MKPDTRFPGKALFAVGEQSSRTWQGPPLRSRNCGLRNISQLTEGIEQRNAIDARRQWVEELGGVGVASGPVPAFRPSRRRICC